MGFDRRSFMRGAAWAGAAALGLLGRPSPAGPEAVRSADPVRVRVWCEGTAPRAVYPQDVDGVIGEALRRHRSLVVSQGRLTDPDAGLSDADLDATDALIWWGRLRHDDLPEDRARAVVERVQAGRLGFVALHASHASKPFRALMGTPCEPKAWREDGRSERIAIKAPEHPMARGVAPFTIPRSVTYVEPFSVPPPEAVVLVSSWDDGETFRSGLTWTIGQGRVAYFRPGHDGFPVLFHPAVRRVIANAALWVAKRA
ncbi:MAG: ThuA domain-containing protein [Isosphaeraceae bacterium]|nr:ThuA domain-containing protein [Isosphaeraceae bacterium]